MKTKIPAVFLCVFLCSPLFTQTHTSVQLENQVYYILEQAEIRGLCASLSGARPYTQSVVVAAINEILNSEKEHTLRDIERDTLVQYLVKFEKPKTGIDWQRGAFYNETAFGKKEMIFSINVGVGADVEGSGGFYSSFKERYLGTEIWARAYINGDLGGHVSYAINAAGGLMKVPRNLLGTYNTYYEGFEDDGQYVNREIDVYSGPMAHFPYTYKKRWDGSVFYLSDLSGLAYWPESVAGGYGLLSELTASFLENKLIVRLGRMSREWGGAPLGSSLVFNQMARPFIGMEAEFHPFSWFSIASLTGALEYLNTESEKISSSSFQNAFSITMLQFRYKNYLFFDYIDSVVWPKRFEIGYISPITNSFLYQNNVGDFDNLAMTFNLKMQYPGLGNVWFSLFLDEAKVSSDMFDLDRTMLAWQAGTNVSLGVLAFTSLKVSYTKVSPYAYTHNRNYNPWYGDVAMETSYTNNGVSLGYYLPPNSDELLFRFKTMPVKNLTTTLQYQIIRHGADFGSSAVDGSNLLSELDPHGRSGTHPQLYTYFLKDGAYQWMHVIRAGAEWNVPKLPVALYGEVGMNRSYFTNIDAPANTGKPYPYTEVNSPEYPTTTGFIVKIGFRVFPR